MSLGRLAATARTVSGKADRSWKILVYRFGYLRVVALVIVALYVALLLSLGLIWEPAAERYLMAASYGMVVFAVCIAWSHLLKS